MAPLEVEGAGAVGALEPHLGRAPPLFGKDFPGVGYRVGELPIVLLVELKGGRAVFARDAGHRKGHGPSQQIKYLLAAPKLPQESAKC